METKNLSESKLQLKKEFDTNNILYENLKQEVNHILEMTLKEKDVKIHSILSRIKEFESFYEKIDRKNIEKPFLEIKDIIGIRVICLFKSDIEKIGEIIKEHFEVIEEDNKIDDFDQISSFGYMSFHYIAKLKNEYTGPRYDQIKTINFEIQVRTISMDAWANISHYLDYKSEEDIPKNLKKDFYALSGLFYVADSHFEFFMKSILDSQKEKESEVKIMLENEQDENKFDEANIEELTFDSLKVYLDQKFKDRKPSNSKDVSILLQELLQAGYSSLNELDAQINRTKDAFERFELTKPPSESSRYVPVGIVRSSLCIIDDAYFELRNPDKQQVDYNRFRSPDLLELIPDL